MYESTGCTYLDERVWWLIHVKGCFTTGSHCGDVATRELHVVVVARDVEVVGVVKIWTNTDFSCSKCEIWVRVCCVDRWSIDRHWVRKLYTGRKLHTGYRMSDVRVDMTSFSFIEIQDTEILVPSDPIVGYLLWPDVVSIMMIRMMIIIMDSNRRPCVIVVTTATTTTNHPHSSHDLLSLHHHICCCRNYNNNHDHHIRYQLGNHGGNMFIKTCCAADCIRYGAFGCFGFWSLWPRAFMAAASATIWV